MISHLSTGPAAAFHSCVNSNRFEGVFALFLPSLGSLMLPPISTDDSVDCDGLKIPPFDREGTEGIGGDTLVEGNGVDGLSIDRGVAMDVVEEGCEV